MDHNTKKTYSVTLSEEKKEEPKKKSKSLEEIREEILINWKERHNLYGIKRGKLEKLSGQGKKRVKKVIARMRRKKEIRLKQRYYYVNN